MKTANFLALLECVKSSGDNWTARCPAHDDHTASLSVAQGNDGRILVKCHAGCPVENIVAELGLKIADLFPAQPDQNATSKSTIVATYPYTDETGTPLFETVRYVPKNFKQRRPDPQKPGEFIWNLKGARRVLYRLPAVVAAVKDGKTIFIAEGEKDCDRLVKEGFVATCNPMGADPNASKWLPEHTETLRGAASVIVIADKDEPHPKTGVSTGRAFAAVVASRLHGVVGSVKLIELPDVNGKKVKDAADFFAAGGFAERLEEIVKAAPKFVPATESTVDDSNGGNLGQDFMTPSRWFEDKYPSLSKNFGEPVLQARSKKGDVSVRSLNEDFMAATLGEKGSPAAPTVYLPDEAKFYQYAPSAGIYVNQTDPVLMTQISALFLECARACDSNVDTTPLKFNFRQAKNLNGLLRKARGLLAEPIDYFSSNFKDYLPCANGMLRLKDMELLTFSPAYRRRNKLAVAYDPSAKCPLFLDTLMRPALDDDDLDLLQRWSGLALIGENVAQAIAILTGTPNGGKGTFLRVLTGIIGQVNLATLRPQLLNERFELGRFLGKTLLYGPDVPEDFLNQRGASVLKSLTGADPMTLEFKGSNKTPGITCRFNIIATSNSRLVVHLEGDVEAWRRRLVIVDYHRPKPKEVIADLDRQILATEASGVLNWMLAGQDKLRADGWQLKLTAGQQAAVDNLLLESDGVAVFTREGLQRSQAQCLTVADCYTAYVEFCNQRAWVALTRNRFTAAIKDAVVRHFGITTRHDIQDSSAKAQVGWKGLAPVGNIPKPTSENLSELSETPHPTAFSDSSDTLLAVEPANTLVEHML